ncbi:hypothetical protein B7P43_G13660 [Cryptotermes secundus]|uniref:HAT C-terminal dimerisation domain-containing protein n=1 Tax=Cryptotermes secundus TaxID=105785 RepID=A0A2J7QX48_9NEOP|nr:hypothetical protein B7P43_G13660 [Cryptotermes secundus]
MKRLTDIICQLGKRQLALRGLDEGVDSIDRGNYVELVHVLRKYDHKLNVHLENSTLLTGLSKRIQNDLTDSISDVILTEIKREVSSAAFVAVMVDEMTNIRSQSQLSIVLRYATSDSEIQEQFLGFSDVSADRTASALAERVTDCVVQYDFGSKIVAQTYDGRRVLQDFNFNFLLSVFRDLFSATTFLFDMLQAKSNSKRPQRKRLINYRVNDCVLTFLKSPFLSLNTAYGQHFNFPRLRSELSVFNFNKDLNIQNESQLLLHLKPTNIDSALRQLTKLCELIVTIPASSASVERSFSALKRIKTYARNSQGEGRMSRLSLLSSEKKLLEHIRNNEGFYDHVNNNFAAKDRRIDLFFK